MRVYLEVLKYNFKIASAYKLELIGFLLRQVFKLLFLLYFWYVLGKTNNTTFDVKQILSYFLIGIGIAEITVSSTYAFGRYIQKQIKRGEFSNQIIKPVHLLRYIYASFLGVDAYSALYSFLIIIVGVFLYPPSSLFSILLFVVFLVLAFAISMSLNVLLAVVGFYSPEAGSFKNVLMHTTRILSGSLIPLSFFPAAIRSFTELTPFPALVFYPVTILQKGYLGLDTFRMFGVSAIWALGLMFFARYVWKKALRNYDGVGI